MAAVEKTGKDFWGPPFWELIHLLSYVTPHDKKTQYVKFIGLVSKVLPCEMCKRNLVAKIDQVPPTKFLQSQKQTLYYSYVIHDMANQQITKYYSTNPPKISPQISTVYKKYAELARDNTKKRTVVWHVWHVLATTLKYDNGYLFRDFIRCVINIMDDPTFAEHVNAFLNAVPIEPYLRNNHDAFLYSYLLHQYTNKKLKANELIKYVPFKNFYFKSLKEECNDCKI